MMKNIVAAVLLTVATTGAMAELVTVGSNGQKTVYADTSTIRKNGYLVKMWDIFDFNSPQTAGTTTYLSSRDQTQYDCREESMRILAMSNHSGHMGAGETVYYSAKQGEWMPVAPGTAARLLWNIACGQQ